MSEVWKINKSIHRWTQCFIDG